MVNIDFIELPGGWFNMGAADAPHREDGEGPIRRVWVDKFKVSKTAISNRDFRDFVEVTKYKTLAEEIGSSFVFFQFLNSPDDYDTPFQMPIWRSVPGAYWSAPEGPGSNVSKRLNHPVVHISLRDVLAFCGWCNVRLLSEAEWEYAARGDLEGQKFPWGDDLQLNGNKMANVWEGSSPLSKSKLLKKFGTVKIDAFEPNNFGLYNMVGNTWELVGDRFTNLHSPRMQKNPKGPLNGENVVIKGGSYLCHESYCTRYRVPSRQAVKLDSTTGHIGFRVAFN